MHLQRLRACTASMTTAAHSLQRLSPAFSSSAPAAAAAAATLLTQSLQSSFALTLTQQTAVDASSG